MIKITCNYCKEEYTAIKKTGKDRAGNKMFWYEGKHQCPDTKLTAKALNNILNKFIATI